MRTITTFGQICHKGPFPICRLIYDHIRVSGTDAACYRDVCTHPSGYSPENSKGCSILTSFELRDKVSFEVQFCRLQRVPGYVGAEYRAWFRHLLVPVLDSSSIKMAMLATFTPTEVDGTLWRSVKQLAMRSPYLLSAAQQCLSLIAQEKCCHCISLSDANHVTAFSALLATDSLGYAIVHHTWNVKVN